jgi:drug/metabolite transporter (DMT)-like permease
MSPSPVSPDRPPSRARRLLDRANGSAWLLLALTALFWAGNVPAARFAVGEISPMTIVVGRWALAGALAFSFLRKTPRAEWMALRAYWPQLLGLGFALAVSNALLFSAAAHTTGVNLAILQGVTPALVVIGAYAIFGAPIGAVTLLGLMLALAGVGLVATGGAPQSLLTSTFNIGDLYQLVASCLYAAYALLLRNRPPGSAWAVFGVISAASFVFSIPLLAMEVAAGAFVAPTWRGLLMLAYVAVFTSLLGQLFFMRGVELVGPSRAAMFQNLTPVLGALLSVLLLGEKLAGYHAAALALVLGGIYLCERWGKR